VQAAEFQNQPINEKFEKLEEQGCGPRCVLTLGIRERTDCRVGQIGRVRGVGGGCNIGDGELRAQQGATAEADATEVRGATDDEERAEFGAIAKPVGESADFTERAETMDANQFIRGLLVPEKDEVVALRRRNRLGDLKEIERNGQVHFGEAANFETADAEESGGDEVLAEECEGVRLAVHFAGENKEEIGGTRLFGNGKPGLQARRQGAE